MSPNTRQTISLIWKIIECILAIALIAMGAFALFCHQYDKAAALFSLLILIKLDTMDGKNKHGK